MRPLWQAAIATITIDHVVKAVDGRGKFAIGSERKVGGVDVHLGFEPIGEPLHRGGRAVYKLVTHKDRPGFLTRPRAAELELVSDPGTHHIAWTFRPALSTDEPWKPTVYMERISRFLEQAGEPVSRNTVEQNVKGMNAKVKRSAMDLLVAHGYAEESAGSHGARLLYSLKPFRDPTSSSSCDFVSSSSDEDALSSSTSSPAYRRDEDEDEDKAEHNGRRSSDEVEPLRALFHDTEPAAEELAP